MNDVKKIIDEIYALDSDLKNHDQELKKIIKK